MKKISISMLAVILGLAACAKPPGEPLKTMEKIKSLYGEQKFEEAAGLFTGSTRRALNDLERVSPGTRQAGFGFAVLFPGESEWEVLESKTDGATASVRVRYARHPVENIRGNEIEFRLRKEDGGWKWDMEREITESIGQIRAVPAESGN